jgi:hypothetical protein
MRGIQSILNCVYYVCIICRIKKIVFLPDIFKTVSMISLYPPNFNSKTFFSQIELETYF